jgi:hypothetical protein
MAKADYYSEVDYPDSIKDCFIDQFIPWMIICSSTPSHGQQQQNLGLLLR